MTTYFDESETICHCDSCGRGMTCADVDDIPPEDFHEDYPVCVECLVKKKNARTIAVLEAHGAVRKDEEDETETEEQVKARLRASVAYWQEQLKLGKDSVEYGKPRWEEEEEEDTITEDTIIAGIVCRACSHTLPPMTVKQHLNGDFNKTCPHTA